MLVESEVSEGTEDVLLLGGRGFGEALKQGGEMGRCFGGGPSEGIDGGEANGCFGFSVEQAMEGVDAIVIEVCSEPSERKDGLVAHDLFAIEQCQTQVLEGFGGGRLKKAKLQKA